LTYKACVIREGQNAENWTSVEAEDFNELLDELKRYGNPFRVLIFKVINRE